MQERRLNFERLDSRDLCAIVGLGTESETPAAERRVVPVTIDDSTGVRSAEVRLRYDAAAWNVEPSAIKTGNAWVRGGATMAKVDPAAGEITVFVFALDALSGDQGNLINLEFSPQTAAADASPTVELKSVRLNEGTIAADVEPGDDLTAVISDAVVTSDTVVTSDSIATNDSVPANVSEECSSTDEDYINPRVRAKFTATTLSPSVLDRERDRPLLTRQPNSPMGPIPLSYDELSSTPTTLATDTSLPTVRQSVQRPMTSWLLMLADEDSRLRKRAA